MNQHKTKIFLFAGELSADLHGGRLMRSLKSNHNCSHFIGVGGPDMRFQGIDGSLRMEDFSVMGFTDVLKSLPRLWLQFRKVRSQILQECPDKAIFIDSPSFSLPMAKSLRKKGFKGKIVQYISPTVWAWRKHRIHPMAEHLDLLLTIYPFEAIHFAPTKLPVKYVGNPVREAIRHHRYDSHWKTIFGIRPSAEIIALFPGSRPTEIKYNLPMQLEAVRLMRMQFPKAVLAISCALEHNRELLHAILEKSGLRLNHDVFFIPKAYTYDLMKASRSAIAKSGTVTLELALHQCPTVVIYQASWLNKMIAKHLLRISLPHYCIVNILKGETVFPELIAEDFSAQALCEALIKLHAEGPFRTSCITQCDEIQNMLPEIDTSIRAAKAIVDLEGSL